MTNQQIGPTSNQTPKPIRNQSANSIAAPQKENVNVLGYYLDGWADLIEGMGEKADEVRTKVLEGLLERNMPQIDVSNVTGYVSELGGERRDIHFN